MIQAAEDEEQEKTGQDLNEEAKGDEETKDGDEETDFGFQKVPTNLMLLSKRSDQKLPARTTEALPSERSDRKIPSMTTEAQSGEVSTGLRSLSLTTVKEEWNQDVTVKPPTPPEPPDLDPFMAAMIRSEMANKIEIEEDKRIEGIGSHGSWVFRDLDGSKQRGRPGLLSPVSMIENRPKPNTFNIQRPNSKRTISSMVFLVARPDAKDEGGHGGECDGRLKLLSYGELMKREENGHCFRCGETPHSRQQYGEKQWRMLIVRDDEDGNAREWLALEADETERVLECKVLGLCGSSIGGVIPCFLVWDENVEARVEKGEGAFPKSMRHKGTNMLSRFLLVCHPIAKQALIIAIDFLGNVILNSVESGAPFALKGRDQQFEYILILMEHVHYDFVDYDELLSTKALAINACTTLVSVEPKLMVETRNNVMKATLGFFAIQNDPVEVVNLITSLCATLLTGGGDGRSRSEQLMLILSQIDQFVSSLVELERACHAVYEMLIKFRMVCVSSCCALGCHGSCAHNMQIVCTLYRGGEKVGRRAVEQNFATVADTVGFVFQWRFALSSCSQQWDPGGGDHSLYRSCNSANAVFQEIAPQVWFLCLLSSRLGFVLDTTDQTHQCFASIRNTLFQITCTTARALEEWHAVLSCTTPVLVVTFIISG